VPAAASPRHRVCVVDKLWPSHPLMRAAGGLGCGAWRGLGENLEGLCKRFKACGPAIGSESRIVIMARIRARDPYPSARPRRCHAARRPPGCSAAALTTTLPIHFSPLEEQTKSRPSWSLIPKPMVLQSRWLPVGRGDAGVGYGPRASRMLGRFSPMDPPHVCKRIRVIINVTATVCSCLMIWFEERAREWNLKICISH